MNVNDKISLIIDVNQMFDINDRDTINFLSGDLYLLDKVYKKSLTILKERLHYKFINIVSEKIMSLSDWMKYYSCDSNDPKSVTIFLRYATLALKRL